MSVLNPVDIEKAIQDCSRRIHNGVTVTTNAEAVSREASHALDVAIAKAYMAYDGPSHAKRYAATIATQDERTAADVAELAYKLADRTARALENELRAWQSVGASIRAMYAGEKGFGG